MNDKTRVDEVGRCILKELREWNKCKSGSMAELFRKTCVRGMPGQLLCLLTARLQQELHVAPWHIFVQAVSISLAFQTFPGHFAVHVAAARQACQVLAYCQFQQGEKW